MNTQAPGTFVSSTCTAASSHAQARPAATRLLVTLEAACPADLEVFLPLDTVITPTLVLAPDLLVAPAGMRGRRLDRLPLLVVEIRSPSTAVLDRTVRKEAYERAGIPAYWIVDPGPQAPSLTAFELHDGRYAEVARVLGDERFEARTPFPVTVVPSCLVGPRGDASGPAE